jgi:hypothetical protein
MYDSGRFFFFTLNALYKGLMVGACCPLSPLSALTE